MKKQNTFLQICREIKFNGFRLSYKNVTDGINQHMFNKQVDEHSRMKFKN